MLEGVTLLLLVVLALSVVFDYINGFHDTAQCDRDLRLGPGPQAQHAILLSARRTSPGR